MVYSHVQLHTHVHMYVYVNLQSVFYCLLAKQIKVDGQD